MPPVDPRGLIGEDAHGVTWLIGTLRPGVVAAAAVDGGRGVLTHTATPGADLFRSVAAARRGVGVVRDVAAFEELLGAVSVGSHLLVAVAGASAATATLPPAHAVRAVSEVSWHAVRMGALCAPALSAAELARVRDLLQVPEATPEGDGGSGTGGGVPSAGYYYCRTCDLTRPFRGGTGDGSEDGYDASYVWNHGMLALFHGAGLGAMCVRLLKGGARGASAGGATSVVLSRVATTSYARPQHAAGASAATPPLSLPLVQPPRSAAGVTAAAAAAAAAAVMDGPCVYQNADGSEGAVSPRGDEPAQQPAAAAAPPLYSPLATLSSAHSAESVQRLNYAVVSHGDASGQQPGEGTAAAAASRRLLVSTAAAGCGGVTEAAPHVSAYSASFSTTEAARSAHDAAAALEVSALAAAGTAYAAVAAAASSSS
eukprot:Rhum_TRINITY_DN15354_c16_g1::Rhum_TRINITY_DN15354_c16_g1_i1::g.154122::m.154122